MSDTIGRITPEAVLAARAAMPQYGVARGQFALIFNGKECLCGMSLVAVHRGKATARDRDRASALRSQPILNRDVSYDYARSFMYGFDACGKPWHNDDQGYQDGIDCAASLGFISPDKKIAD